MIENFVLAAGGIFMIFLYIGLGLFWLWSLIDVLVSGKTTGEKALYLMLIIFLNVLGSFLYFFFGRDNRTSKTVKKRYKKMMN